MSIHRRIERLERDTHGDGADVCRCDDVRVMVVHRDGDHVDLGLFVGAPWCGGQPVNPSELQGKDVLLVSWVTGGSHDA